jgi:hypothetical protein
MMTGELETSGLAALPADLVDADVRARLIGDLDRTFFVEAGAGTGKTKSSIGS